VAHTRCAKAFYISLRVILPIACIATLLSWTPLPATAQNGPYTITIFADSGAGPSTSAPDGTSGSGPNLGHVFIELANGDKQMFIGYYGYGPSGRMPTKGQLRVDADLFRNGDYDVSKTYQITSTGYINAHQLLDIWGGPHGEKWGVYCNCADFAQTVASSAGLDLTDVPTDFGVNMPKLWAQYLRTHGGTVNNHKPSTTNTASASDSEGILGKWEADSCGFSQAIVLIVSKDSSGNLVGTFTAKNIITANGGGACTNATWDGTVSQGIFHNAVFASSRLSFSTVLDGENMGASMTLTGNGLVWSSPGGDRYVLHRVS
jgi:hypothetical protein